MAERVHATEDEARDLAESSRADWSGRGFLRELFLGNLRVDWVDPFPTTEQTPGFREYYDRLEQFLAYEVDSSLIDETGELPASVLDGLRELGAFGFKIDPKYGGHGFTQAEYCELIELVDQLGVEGGRLLVCSDGVVVGLRLVVGPAETEKSLRQLGIDLQRPPVGGD